MRKEWSSQWKSSTQPRKQRKFRANAPLHVKRKLVSAHLSPQLRKDRGTRSLPLRKGDEVRILRGKHKSVRGSVERVQLSKSRIFVAGANVKKSDGSESPAPIRPENVMITRLNLDDSRRLKSLDRKRTRAAAGPASKTGPKKEASKPGQGKQTKEKK